MEKAEVLVVLADALEISEEDIAPDLKLVDIPTYDSAGVLAIIASVDRSLGKSVDPDKLAACSTVQDVVELILA